jgi:uncharacterized secreted protein with C-terminal beta-propeller domain
MKVARIALAAVFGLALAASLGVQAPAAPATGRLVAFSSCSKYLGYVKSHAAPFVTAYGLGQNVRTAVPTPAAAAAARGQTVDYSTTNVQEAGVDEPDLVKTDGRTLFTVENGQLQSTDVSTGRPKLLDTLSLSAGYGAQLLLAGDHLLLISRGGLWLEPLPAIARAMFAPQPQTTTLTEVDVSKPGALKVVQTMTIDGSYVDARMIGSAVRLVSSTAVPVALPFVAGSQDTNKAVLASSRVRSWLPSYRIGKRAARPLVQCRAVRHPASFSGLGMLTVTTLDLAKGLAPTDSTGVMTDGRIVYASLSSLYVATEPWTARPVPARPTTAPDTATTQIHSFDISDPDRTRYLASGQVPGYLLNQWSMSEDQGVLRVVSTDAPAWWGPGQPDSQSFLTTLRARAGTLARLGQVGGLGKGDRVYAVRMIGDTGYVVTFRRIDPLYTLDLHDPAAPKVLGELEIPGYSSYLHPVGSDLLLGIGQYVAPNANEPSGTQVSLFDVKNPRHPTRLAEARLGQGWSAAESDHHAFLYWPATGVVVVPFGQQAVAMHVGRSGIRELGRVNHSRSRQSQLPQIDRSVVVGRGLFTISSGGVAANDLSTLVSLGWAAFPEAPQPKPVR